MATLPDRSHAKPARLVTAITVAIGVLAVISGIADYADNAAAGFRVVAVLSVIFGLACVAVGLRVKSGAVGRGELAVLAVVMAVLVVAGAWLSSSLKDLLGLAVPAALLMLCALSQ